MNNPNLDVYYQMGKLYALIEREVDDSSKINERVFASYMTSPEKEIVPLIRLYEEASKKEGNTHITAAEEEYLDTIKRIDNFPSSVSAENQSSIALGYYHHKK